MPQYVGTHQASPMLSATSVMSSAFGSARRGRGCYQQALIGDASRASSRRLIGHVLQYWGRFDEAARCYEADARSSPRTRETTSIWAVWRRCRENQDG